MKGRRIDWRTEEGKINVHMLDSQRWLESIVFWTHETIEFQLIDKKKYYYDCIVARRSMQA